MPGTGELIVLGFVLVVVFSAARMGALGNALGKFVHSFKKASRGQDLIEVNPRSDRKARPEDPDAEVVSAPKRPKSP
jgi:sec-independent protein translocase protein TatA